MPGQANKLTRLLGLAQPGVLGALVAVLWLMLFLGLYLEPAIRRNPALDRLGVIWALILSAVVASGLGVFMLALNDALDARHDRAFDPDKPIPSGKVTQRAAFGLAMAGLLAAVAAAVAFGSLSILLTLGTAGAIVFYNVAGRFVPSVGIVTLGLVIGVASLIPNPNLAFAWPILLMMTHVIASATLRYALAGKRPRLTPIHGWMICLGWAFWCMVILVLLRLRSKDITHDGLALVWLGPLIATVLFGLMTWFLLGPAALAARARRATARRFSRFATAWLIVFNASWLFSAGLWWQGLAVFALLIVPVMHFNHGIE